MLDSDGVILLAKNFPNSGAMKFLDCFLYSDNSIDGQIRQKKISKGGFQFVSSRYVVK
jgi:cell filamentation protein